MNNLQNSIKYILGANIVMFAITFFIPGMSGKMNELFALYFPKNENFEFWQIVTTMFMHGSYMHIIFNMYALWAFGSPLAKIWGDKRFYVFYFLAGIGASLIYTFVNYIEYHSLVQQFSSYGITPTDIESYIAAFTDFSSGRLNESTFRGFLNSGFNANSQFANVPVQEKVDLLQLVFTPAVGASGAIYGVLVAFGLMFPNAKLALIFFPVPISAKYFIPVLIGLDLFSGLTGVSLFGGGIAHFAHIGGALIGFLLMMYWKAKANRKLPFQ